MAMTYQPKRPHHYDLAQIVADIADELERSGDNDDLADVVLKHETQIRSYGAYIRTRFWEFGRPNPVEVAA